MSDEQKGELLKNSVVRNFRTTNKHGAIEGKSRIIGQTSITLKGKK